MAVEFLERFGLIENERYLLAGEVFDSKKVLQALQHGFPLLPISPGLPKDCRIFRKRDRRERRVPRRQFPSGGLPLFRCRLFPRFGRRTSPRWAFRDGRGQSARKGGCAWDGPGRKDRSSRHEWYGRCKAHRQRQPSRGRPPENQFRLNESPAAVLRWKGRRGTA